MNDLDSQRQQLAKLLAAKRLKENSEASHSIQVKRHDIDRVPASFSQARLWFLDKLQGTSEEYNIPLVFEVQGELDTASAERAIVAIISKHHSLRTVFTETEDGITQVVRENFQFSIEHQSVTAVSTQELQRELTEIKKQHASYAFDLSNDLMIRASYVNYKCSGDEPSTGGVLLLNIHHIASDGWSMNIFLNEFVNYYEALVSTGKLPESVLQIQYADYAIWQREWFFGEKQEKQLNYWEQQLKDAPIVHNLPLDFSRPQTKQYEADVVYGGLSTAQLSALKNKAQTYEMTPFMVIHAALSLVLSRYSNSTDIVIGTPVANRPQKVLENLIGFFANTLVLRTNTDFDYIDDFFKHVRSVHLGALSYQDMPFELLVDRLNVTRTMAHNPLFQIALINNGGFDAATNKQANNVVEAAGIVLTNIANEDALTKFDITIDITATEQGVSFKWKYDKSLFKHQTIEKMNQHFINMLESIVTVSSRELSTLSMLSTLESDELINAFNDTDVDYPIEQCLHELFIKQVIHTPDNIAIVDQKGQLTYAELFKEAYLLSAFLSETGVQNEQLIAVRMLSQRKQVIACMAILLAGGAYLPLETKWPEKRCLTVCQKANCQLVLIDDESYAISGVLCKDSNSIADEPINVIEAAKTANILQQPSDLAYVIFTSGSTGEPKGVAIEHRSAVNTILDINAQYGVDHSDKVFAVSLLSFDLSVYDIFGLLAVGGQVVFGHDDKLNDPAHWLETIEQHQVTVWNSVPVSAALVAEQLSYQERKSTAPLKCILMSGDWIDPELPNKLWHYFPGVKTYSLGGATEGSIWSINYPIVKDPRGAKSVPYGKPLSNQQFYILGPNNSLAPKGTVGELCIGGVGVAREYYAAPELTAERFFVHPLLDNRLYRTGDLGRYAEDGNIEFLGRVDHQVKIRGFRIEIGEIEQRLRECVNVNSCLVVAKQSEAGGQFLVAYVKTARTNSVSQEKYAEELRAELATHLLDYMLPDCFVFIDEWPLTANGKVDNKSLPLPDFDKQHQAYSPPETNTEKALVQIWAELLSRSGENIGIYDNFNYVGGNSLLVVRMVSKIQQQFSVSIDISDVYTLGNVHVISSLVDEKLALKRIEDKLSEQDTEEVEEFTL